MHTAGVPDSNIVLFHYNDIANNTQNPLPGQVINSPYGPNVYQNIPMDYTGADVNAQNVLAALQGDSEALKGVGSGKVINSGPNDNVFFYFADHGGAGILGMPTGEAFLYAKDLNAAIQAKHDAQGFNEMVIYIEACESGSIFNAGQLPTDINVYALTAANPTESSWGCYCPGMPIYDQRFNTCLGDLFSVNFLQDCDKEDLTTETLGDQATTLTAETASNSTGQGSHVSQYGSDGTFAMSQTVSTFIGEPSTKSFGDIFGLGKHAAKVSPKTHGSLEDTRESEYLYLERQVAAGVEGAEADLHDFVVETATATAQVSAIINKLSLDDSVKTEAREDKPVVDDWDCYKGVIGAFSAECSNLYNQRHMKHTRTLANICNAGVSVEDFTNAARSICH
jgi:legumain